MSETGATPTAWPSFLRSPTRMRLPPNDGAPWPIGLSGGADSVALLCRAQEAGLPVTALHFNHAFSDENGDAEEAFVRELCAARHIPLTVGRCTETQPANESKEVFARRCRFAFFAKYAAGRVMLAHHADDRAENLILRLMRGCGLEGLTSFGEASSVAGLRIVRPLLDETHADQIRWLKAHRIGWMEDVSNGDLTVPRNLIRHTLREALPTFTSGANTSLDHLTEENRFLAELTAAATLSAADHHLRLKEGTSPVLMRRALRGWLLKRFGHTPTRRQMTLLETPQATVMLTPTLRVRHTSPTLWETL